MTNGFTLLLNWKYIYRLLQGLFVTLQIAFTSVVLSIVIGIVLGILITSKKKWIQVLFQIYLTSVRILPQLVLLFVVYFGFSMWFRWNISAFTSAVIVFTYWGAAEMADLVRGALLSIDRHQYESAQALGFTKYQMYRYIILPQAIRRLLPPTMNLVTRMIKTTALVEIIGMTEVLKIGQQIIDANRLEYPDGALWIYGAVFVLYFLLCWPISSYAKKLERKWQSA